MPVTSAGDEPAGGGSPAASAAVVVRSEPLGQSPVHHQRLAVGAEHEVRRLQVAVHDPLVVGVGHRVADGDELLEQAAEPQAPPAGIAAERLIVDETRRSPAWSVWPSIKGMV